MRAKGGVLGKATLALYRETLAKTTFPSHVKHAPEGLGSAATGSLTADEWNSVSLILLPLTLVPHWGAKKPGSREKALLDNYAHLVGALRLLGRRSTSQEIADRIEKHLAEYFRGVIALFPGNRLHPNHHMLGHSPDVLMDYGPVRGWACWAFEFLNGVAQKIPTNRKEGK